MKAAPVRIGIYEPSRGRSGPSRYVESVLAGLDPEEFEVILFCQAGGPYRTRPGVSLACANDCEGSRTVSEAGGAVAGGTFHRGLQHGWRAVAPGWLKQWTGFGRECLRLASWFRRQQVALLHSNNAGCEEAAVGARLAGVQRVLATFHVDSTYDLEGTRAGMRYRLLEFLSNHSLDKAIAVSEATRRDWIRRTHVRAERTVTIHNGVDPHQFVRRNERAEARRRLGLPADDRLIVGGVGRLESAKGFSYLLEAVSLLAPRYAGLTVAVVGQGPLRQTLAVQASRLGIADRVHFLGFCRDVQQVYDGLDIFVLPSLCEALPYALLEAMATGLPAVGTRVGGVPEMIVPGESGFLVPARSAPALADALRPLLDAPQLRQSMGQAGRERVIRHFDEQTMVRRTIQIYREMLGTPCRAARKPPSMRDGGSK